MADRPAPGCEPPRAHDARRRSSPLAVARARRAQPRRDGQRRRRRRDFERVRAPARGSRALLRRVCRDRLRPRGACRTRRLDPDALRAPRGIRSGPPARTRRPPRVSRGRRGRAAPERHPEAGPRAANGRGRQRDGPLECCAGVALLMSWTLVAATGFVLTAPLALVTPPARAGTLQTLDGALAQAFPGARIERRTLALSPADVKAVEARAHARCDARLVTAYIAWRGDTLAGAGYTDRRVVRTREALLFVAVAPDTSMPRIEVLPFFEPPDYRPPPRWLALFAHRREDPRLRPGDA